MLIFIDSSVVVAALFSSTGASAEIFELCEMSFCKAVISECVVDEVERTLKKKSIEHLNIFRDLLKISKVKILPKPTKKELNTASSWIKDPDDVHILASAKSVNVDALLTLDIRHFIKDENVSRLSGLDIFTPGEFLNSIDF
ncbi:MAG: PIN domain-containing protein [Candidatus Peregrinibacteria bacterium]|nr:PIN domain-containing protein [Candidatus Peregrinibacteria bacterium]MDZ4245219.1 PIN domain-containing protein [Candidatus Gracilibacteria bacterium]